VIQGKKKRQKSPETKEGKNVKRNKTLGGLQDRVGREEPVRSLIKREVMCTSMTQTGKKEKGAQENVGKNLRGITEEDNILDPWGISGNGALRIGCLGKR